MVTKERYRREEKQNDDDVRQSFMRQNLIAQFPRNQFSPKVCVWHNSFCFVFPILTVSVSSAYFTVYFLFVSIFRNRKFQSEWDDCGTATTCARRQCSRLIYSIFSFGRTYLCVAHWSEVRDFFFFIATQLVWACVFHIADIWSYRTTKESKTSNKLKKGKKTVWRQSVNDEWTRENGTIDLLFSFDFGWHRVFIQFDCCTAAAAVAVVAATDDSGQAINSLTVWNRTESNREENCVSVKFGFDISVCGGQGTLHSFHRLYIVQRVCELRVTVCACFVCLSRISFCTILNG